MEAGCGSKKHIRYYSYLDYRVAKKDNRSESVPFFLIEPQHSEIDQADKGIEQNWIPPTL